MAKTTASVLTLNPKEVMDFILNAIRVQDVPYIAGPPAIGKSQTIHQAFKKANLKIIDLRLSQILSEDLTGIPERSGNKAIYLPFEMFPLESDPLPTGYDGWGLLLDELPDASEEVLAAAYSLILDRTVGGRKLHKRVAIVAAGNRTTDSAIARELPDTLITRMLPVNMEVQTKSWLKWANTVATASNETVIEFINKHPTMLYSPTAKESRTENETYPTPRGWEKVMKHVNLHEKVNSQVVDVEDSAGVKTGKQEKSCKAITSPFYHLMLGAVGPLGAKAFKDFYDESMSSPPVWEIAQSPHSVRVPASIAAKTKIVEELVGYWIASNEQTRENVLAYVNRIGGDPSAIFHRKVAAKLGSSPSDIALANLVAKRLGIDPLLGSVATPKLSSQEENDELF